MEEFFSPISAGSFLAGVIFTSILNLIGFAIFISHGERKTAKLKRMNENCISEIESEEAIQ